jgi:hypothetical protein
MKGLEHVQRLCRLGQAELAQQKIYNEAGGLLSRATNHLARLL